MYDFDLTPLFLFLLALIAFFAVAATFGWVPALWTGGGMIAVSVIRNVGRW